MNQFFFRQTQSQEIQHFPHILEFALKKNNSIQLNSLNATSTTSIRIYIVLEGKYEWIIDGKNYILYPGDLAIVLPGQVFGGENNILHIGTISWICLQVQKLDMNGMSLGKWSQLSKNECLAIGKILSLNKSSVIKLKELIT